MTSSRFHSWRAYDRAGTGRKFLGMLEALPGHEFELARALWPGVVAVHLEPEAGHEWRCGESADFGVTGE
jgi:hypothetical protein